MSAIQHMALGVAGFGCEDALIHLLNYVWPNVFESSPHVVQAFMGAIEGMRVAIGPSKLLQYTLQVRYLVCYFLDLDLTSPVTLVLAPKSSTKLCRISYGKLTNSPTFPLCKAYANECAEASWA